MPQIHWFPGHMASARAEIRRAMPNVDLVIEVLDARLPRSSENPVVAELRGNTPALRILNKSDLADPTVTAEWMAAYTAAPDVRALLHHQGQPHLLKRVREAARALVGPITGRPMVAMIVGIPNVGKSTVINTLAGRTVAKTGNKPAITQNQQRVGIGPDLALFDTPGFLWPKLEPVVCAYRLAVSGAISDRVLQAQDLAVFALRFLAVRYPGAVASTYGLPTLPEEPVELLTAIGRRRGFVVKGGGVDLERAADRLLLDLRAGTLGPLSLERPSDFGG
jgi:ribosome biogenesis GTPase A